MTSRSQHPDVAGAAHSLQPRLRHPRSRSHRHRSGCAAVRLSRRLRQLVQSAHRAERPLPGSRSSAKVRDTGKPDTVVKEKSARQHPIEELPEEALVFLLASRYCDTEKLSQAAPGVVPARPSPAGSGCRRFATSSITTLNSITWTRDPTRTASEAFKQRRGVCRDFTHLAIAFCRSLNIPARYCTGYLSDIGTPKYALGRRRLCRVVRGLCRRGAGRCSIRVTMSRASAGC